MKPAAINIKEVARRAYMAGFCSSAQGFNAEYPYNGDERLIERELSEAFGSFFEWLVENMPTEGGDR